MGRNEEKLNLIEQKRRLRLDGGPAAMSHATVEPDFGKHYDDETDDLESMVQENWYKDSKNNIFSLSGQEHPVCLHRGW